MAIRICELLVLVMLAAGCHSYITVRVTLIDEMTGRPVVGASVRPDYSYFLDPWHPDVSPRFTNADGSVDVPLDVDPKAGTTASRYSGLWIGGDFSEVGPGINDDRSYMLADPVGGELIQRPTPEEVKNALLAAAGDLKRVSPIPVTLRVLSLRAWWAKYRK